MFSLNIGFRMLIALMCFHICQTFAQTVYPAERAHLWGFINEKGEWVKKPCFEGYLGTGNGLHMMVQKDSLSYDVLIFNAQGELMKNMKNAAEMEWYRPSVYDSSIHYSLLDYNNIKQLAEEVMYGRVRLDSLENEQSLWFDDGYRLYDKDLAPEGVFVNGDSIAITQDENIFKIWFKNGAAQLAGNIEELSPDLMLVNQGGYTLARHHRGYESKSGDNVKIQHQYFESIDVIGGKDVLTDQKGNILLEPRSSGKSSWRQYYNYKAQSGLRNLRKLSFVTLEQFDEKTRSTELKVCDFRGTLIFEETVMDSVYSNITGFGKNWIIRFYTSNKNIHHAVLIDERYKVIDTFNDIRSLDHSSVLYSVRKKDRWGILANSGLSTQVSFVSSEICYPVNHHTLYYVLNDSTLNFVDLWNERQMEINASWLADAKDGYFIVRMSKKVFNGNGGEDSRNYHIRNEYNLIDSLGNTLIPYGGTIHFEDTLRFSSASGFSGEDIPEYIKVLEKNDVKNKYHGFQRQSISDAFRVQGFYVRAGGCLMDSSFQCLSISPYRIVEHVNSLWVLRKESTSLFNKGEILFCKGQQKTKWQYDFLFVNLQKMFSESTPYFSVLKTDRQTREKEDNIYYVYLENKGYFIHLNHYMMCPPEDFNELLRIRYYSIEFKTYGWLYLDKNGNIIYNSNPKFKIKVEVLNWKKMNEIFNSIERP